MSNNNQDETAEKDQAQSRNYRFVTLRISPTLHRDVEKMTAQLHFTTGKRVSVNSLVTRYVEEGLRRDTNPKMLRDFVEPGEAQPKE